MRSPLAIARPLCVAVAVAAAALLTGCHAAHRSARLELRPEIRESLISGEVVKCDIQKRQNVLRCEIIRVHTDGRRQYQVASVYYRSKDEFLAFLDQHKVPHTFVERE